MEVSRMKHRKVKGAADMEWESQRNEWETKRKWKLFLDRHNWLLWALWHYLHSFQVQTVRSKLHVFHEEINDGRTWKANLHGLGHTATFWKSLENANNAAKKKRKNISKVMGDQEQESRKGIRRVMIAEMRDSDKAYNGLFG